MGLKEQLIAILEKAGYLSQYPGTMARILMENGVAIPVRCGQCKYHRVLTDHRGSTLPICSRSNLNFEMHEEDYCSKGERRTND